MQIIHIWLTKQLWHATSESSVQKLLGISHTDVYVTQENPVACYSYQRMKLQGFQRTFPGGSQQALGHSCSSDAPEANRETCVIQLRMLQENAAVTTQLSCTYQLSPFGKYNLHFLKARYLQLFQSVPPEFFPPCIWIFSWSCNTGLWWSLQTVSIARCQVLAFPTAQASRHGLTPVLQLIDFKVQHTWLHTKDLGEVFDTNKYSGMAEMCPQNSPGNLIRTGSTAPLWFVKANVFAQAIKRES